MEYHEVQIEVQLSHTFSFSPTMAPKAKSKAKTKAMAGTLKAALNKPACKQAQAKEQEEPDKVLDEKEGEATKNPFAQFDVVIVTIPTDVVYSEKGKEMLTNLNSKVKDTGVYVVLSPGYLMQERVFDHAKINKKRIVYGLPLFLSHSVRFIFWIS